MPTDESTNHGFLITLCGGMCAFLYSRRRRYVDKMATEPEDQFELYMKVNLWERAMLVAQKLRDPERLKRVRVLSKDPRIERAVDQVLATGGF